VRIEFQTTDIADTYEKGGWKRLNGTTVERTVDKPENPMDFKVF
jgi:hypothetical protein